MHDLALGVGVSGPKSNSQCKNMVYQEKRGFLKGQQAKHVLKKNQKKKNILYLFGLWQGNHVFKKKSSHTKSHSHLVITGVELSQSAFLTVHQASIQR